MSKRIEIVPLSPGKRREALLEFHDLLKSEVVEPAWQRFFDIYPNILTDSLSLQLTGICSQVRLVSGKPDYVFHRSLGGVTGDYGVIELKRPQDSIVGTYSVKHIIPSTKVITAQKQTERYLASIQRGEFLNTDDFFVAGNRKHAFIIIGNSAELTERCHCELYRLQFQDLLPPGFDLYTYDEIFRLFSATTPPCVKVLFASDITMAPSCVKARLRVTHKLGIHARPSAMIVQACLRHAAEVRISTNRNETVNAKSIMGLLTLVAPCDTVLQIEATGQDAESLVESLILITCNCEYGGVPKLFELIDYKVAKL